MSQQLSQSPWSCCSPPLSSHPPPSQVPMHSQHGPLGWRKPATRPPAQWGRVRPSLHPTSSTDPLSESHPAASHTHNVDTLATPPIRPPCPFPSCTHPAESMQEVHGLAAAQLAAERMHSLAGKVDELTHDVSNMTKSNARAREANTRKLAEISSRLLNLEKVVLEQKAALPVPKDGPSTPPSQTFVDVVSKCCKEQTLELSRALTQSLAPLHKAQHEMLVELRAMAESCRIRPAARASLLSTRQNVTNMQVDIPSRYPVGTRQVKVCEHGAKRHSTVLKKEESVNGASPAPLTEANGAPQQTGDDDDIFDEYDDDDDMTLPPDVLDEEKDGDIPVEMVDDTLMQESDVAPWDIIVDANALPRHKSSAATPSKQGNMHMALIKRVQRRE